MWLERAVILSAWDAQSFITIYLLTFYFLVTDIKLVPLTVLSKVSGAQFKPCFGLKLSPLSVSAL